MAQRHRTQRWRRGWRTQDLIGSRGRNRDTQDSALTPVTCHGSILRPYFTDGPHGHVRLKEGTITCSGGSVLNNRVLRLFLFTVLPLWLSCPGCSASVPLTAKSHDLSLISYDPPFHNNIIRRHYYLLLIAQTIQLQLSTPSSCLISWLQQNGCQRSELSYNDQPFSWRPVDYS